MFYTKAQPETESITVYHSIKEIPAEKFPENGLFLSKAYLFTLEESAPSGMQFRYILSESEGFNSLYYFQLINLSAVEIGQIINKQPFSGIVKAACDLIHGFLFGTNKNKPHYLMICGNMCLSGPFGISCENAASGPAHLFEAIEHCTKALSKEGKVIGTIIKDFPESNDSYSPVIRHHRYNRLVMDPVMKMQVREEWKEMGDYLAALSAKYRQRFQQARKKIQPFTVKDLQLEDMRLLEDRINELYSAVQDKSPVRLVKPDAGYLIGLKKNLGKKVRFRGIFDGELLIGFMTGIHAGSTYEAHHIGIDYHYNKSHSVYLNILYFYIEMAIDAGAKELSFGRTALEMKTTVGAVADPHNAWLKLNNGMLNSLVKYMLPEKQAEDWIPRNPFKN